MHKKADVVLFKWDPHYIMAVLSWWEEAVTYNICNTGLQSPKFWVKIEEDCLLSSESLSEDIKRKAQYFL